MHFTRPLRLPLATGASVVRALFVPVGVFQLIAFGPLFLPLPDWVVMPLGVLWAVWFFAIVGSVIQGVRRRASDITLSRDGIAIHGGPHRGFRAAWDRIDPARCEVKERANEGAAESVLVLDGREVAVTEEAAEQRSFAAIVDTIRAMCGAPIEARPRSADVLECAHCGAPAPLRDEDSVACRSCGNRVPIPEARRAQIRGLASLESSRARSEQLLRVLQKQRGASYVNLLVLAATPPLILGGPLAAIVFNEFYVTRHAFRWTHGVALFIVGLTFTYALSLLVQGEVVGRAALRMVTLSFGAAPPAREGDPPACRVCGAPIEGGKESVVVICAYCRAENITDIDLCPQASAEATQAGGLEEMLADRLRLRRRYRWSSLLAVVLLAIGAVTFERTFLGPCRNQVRDGDETDVDCGGPCTRCQPGRTCREGVDCRSGICTGGTCAAPRCDDGVRNGDESDVDCGGDCTPCGPGKRCDGGSKSCASGRCSLSGTCE